MPDSRRDWHYLIAGLVVVDIVCLLGAAWGAVWLRDALSQRGVGGPLVLSGLVTVTGVLMFLLLGAYNPEHLLDGTKEYASVVRGCVYGLAAFSLLSFALHRPVSREWIVLSWPMAAAFDLVARYLARRVARGLRRRGHFTRRSLLVGADANAVALAGQLNGNGSGMTVVGFLDDYHPIGSVLQRGVKVLGRTSALHDVATRFDVHDAIVVPQALPWETLQHLITAAAVAPDGPRVHLSAGFYDLVTTSVRFSERHRIPLLTLNKARLTRSEQVVKTALDYAIAAVLLTVSAPVVAVVVVWQKLRRQPQLLQRHQVIGSGGVPFDLLAFRSSAPFDSVVVRKLPGLLNVLAGQMTIVGPRPRSQEDAPSKSVVMAGLRPGLTGPWREADDPAEQALLDLYYVRAYSIALDLQVLHRRVRSHLRRDRGTVKGSLRVETST